MPANYLMNRLSNSTNFYQGSYKRVLCVCSAGLLRSPTAAWVLSQAPYNYNTRAAGITPEFALVPVDEVLLHWAQEIVCMDDRQRDLLREMGTVKPIVVLHIPDNFAYRDPDLIEAIKAAYDTNIGVTNFTIG
jgi:predicted protein tyrosine phosphatase